MRKITNKRTGETFEGELWLAEIKDGKRYLKIEIKDEEDLDYLEIGDEEKKPKEYWAISFLYGGGIRQHTYRGDPCDKFNESVGNFFATKEEAEKFVEKLKAWKRLKDKGFRFCRHDDRDRGQLGDMVIYAEMPTFEYDDDSTRDDLDLLFGDKNGGKD